MTLGLIIFLGSSGVFRGFRGEGFEAIGAFPFADLEALGGGFKGVLEA